MIEHPGHALQTVVDRFVLDLHRGADSIPVAELSNILATSMEMTGQNRHSVAAALCGEFLLRLGLRLAYRESAGQVLAATKMQLDATFRLGSYSVN